MANIRLILDLNLTRGKCYTVSGTASGIGAGESALIEVGNATTTDSVGTVNADGDFSFDFNYTASATFYKSLYFIETGTFDITNLSLKLDSDCATQYCSECFDKNDCDYPGETLNLKWTNNTKDAFGLNYTAVPLTHTLTVKGGLRNYDYNYDEEYFNTSKGFNFPVYVDSIKQIEMWVHDVPEYIHDALRIGIVHDDFRVNNVKYTKVEGGYSPDWDTPNSLLAPVIVKLREQTQDTKNRNC